MTKHLLAVDVGGTFVDAVFSDKNGRLRHLKFPKKWLKQEESPFRTLIDSGTEYDLFYSTTLTLNRLLSGDLPKIALIVNKGFHSIMETARLPTNNLDRQKESVVPLELVREVQGKINFKGEETEPLCDNEITAISEWLTTQKIEVVVVALLNSFLEPKHEKKIADRLKLHDRNLIIIPSAQVVPEISEYERTLAAVLNGCLISFFRQDMRELIDAIPSSPSQTYVMQSNGGISNLVSSERLPVETLLSGPAAAVARVRAVALRAEIANAVSLDVGGTSTDISLITENKWEVISEQEIANFPIRIPMVNVQSIGSGGGSIAHKSPNGRWYVGPQSAGSEPGPACYNLGNETPTLTDAHLILGRLPNMLAAGKVKLSFDAAIQAIKKLGTDRDYDTQKTARSILEIATYDMCGAVRKMAANKGIPLEDYALIAVGGAGPLHAAELANLVGIRVVIIPGSPGTASALGTLEANVSRDMISPFSEINNQRKDIPELFLHLEKKALAWLKDQKTNLNTFTMSRKFDLRYKGMTHKSIVECPVDCDGQKLVRLTIDKFHEHFQNTTGQDWEKREEVEIINLRVTVDGQTTKDLDTDTHWPNEVSSPESERAVGFLGLEKLLTCKIISRNSLKIGDSLNGPCVIEESASTTVVPPYWEVSIDKHHNIILRR